MKLLLPTLALAGITYAIFAAYQIGHDHGTSDTREITASVRAAAKWELCTELGAVHGHPAVGKHMNRENFQQLMTQHSEQHFADLQYAFAKLSPAQQEIVLNELFLTAEEVRELKSFGKPLH